MEDIMLQSLQLLLFQADVLVSATHQQRSTLIITLCNLASVKHPYPMTVFMTHPDFAFIVRKLARQVLFKHNLGRGKIFGVCILQPGFYGNRLKFGKRVTNDAGPVLIEQRLAGLHIPFPGANTRTIQNGVQTPALKRQIFGHDTGSGFCP
ncbi:MAG: hypothetical protein WDA26_11565 [Pusillimonas sp.]